MCGPSHYDPRDDGALIVVPRADQVIDLDTSRAREADCQDIEFELLMTGKTCGDVLTGRYLAAPSRRMEWTPFHAALLVHFFVYGDIKPERRTQFQHYMTAIHQGVPMANAAEVFGDMRKLQFEIGAYADAGAAPPGR